VTGGPTREPIDDVRYLTNASSGLMGWELAKEAARRGARVALVLGPCDLPDPPGVATTRVETTRDLLVAARRAVRGTDLALFAAAPADWRPLRRAKGKIRKEDAGTRLVLRLVENPDVAATLGRRKGRRVHVGFALEVGEALPRARRKMARKRFDAVVVNGPANVGRGGGAAFFVARRGRPERLPTGDKAATAHAILDRATALLEAARSRRRGRSPRLGS
jgi:phosphopantothenoylcysteine decarboxylase/phosphopantothenate--cysteine ligase